MIEPRRNNASGDLEHHLTQIDEYGITVVSDVLSPAELHMLPDLIDRVCKIRELHPLQDDAKVQTINMCSNLVNHDPFFRELCLRPAVYSIMQRLLGDNAVLSTIATLEPRPGATGERGGEIQALHKDGLGGGIEVQGLQGCQSLWLIDSIDPQNGATRFGIGTHRAAPPTQVDKEQWLRAESRLVQMSLPAGSVIVYDARVLHAMSTNHSNRRRRTLACFYTQAGLPRMCDQRFYLSPEVQRQASPQARVLLGLDSPEPLSAGGRFYADGNLPQAPILGK